MTISWFSRHRPTPRQIAELKRLFGPATRIVQDSRTFAGADEVLARYRASGAGEMVIVAPLSVIAALCDRGLRPLWPQMELVPADHPEAEVRIERRDHRGVECYRFSGFRRLTGIVMTFEPINPEEEAGRNGSS